MKSEIPGRAVEPDPIYKSELVSKFINCLMMQGKKSTAQRIFYGAMAQAEERSGKDAIAIFQEALEHVKPTIETKSRRVGGATYQVPIEVAPARRYSLAIHWLIESARQRRERGMMNRLAAELLDAAQNEGGAVKKRENVHRMAEANKAFAHYRW